MSDHPEDLIDDEDLPQRPRSQVLGEIGVDAVKRCMPNEWNFQPSPGLEYGVDATAEVVKGTRVTGFTFAIQVKSKDITVTRDFVSVPKISRSTIKYWHNRPERVMLAVYLSGSDTVVWRWIDDVPIPKTATTTIRVPRTQELKSTNWKDFIHELRVYYGRAAATFSKRIRLESGVASDADSPLRPSYQLSFPRSVEDPVCAVDVYREGSLVYVGDEVCGLIDCGRQSLNEIGRWLGDRKIRHLKFIALSHLHVDHYEGVAALASMIESVDILLLPPVSLVQAAIRRIRETDFDAPVFPNDRFSGSFPRLLAAIVRWQENGTRVISQDHRGLKFTLGKSGDDFAATLTVHVAVNTLYAASYESIRRLAGADAKGDSLGDYKSIDQNMLCPIYEISYRGTRFLLPTDATLATWKEVLEDTSLTARGMVLPHHGSIKHMTLEMLREVFPDPGFVAIYSRLERLGLPNRALLQMVRHLGGVIVNCTKRPVFIRLREDGVTLE